MLQEERDQGMDVEGLLANVTLNATMLTGAFTPEFEVVYYGELPDLGPDPELINDLTLFGTMVNVVAWSSALVLGFDKIS